MLFNEERLLNPVIEAQIHDKINVIRRNGGIRNEDIERITTYADDIAMYADLLHYGEDDEEHPVLEKIIEAVATLAFLPGGFNFGAITFIAVPNVDVSRLFLGKQYHKENK